MTEPASHLRNIGVLQLLTQLSNHLRSPIPRLLRFCRQLVPVEITKVWPMRDPVVINLALLANSCSASVEKILSWMVRKNNTVLAVNSRQ